MMAPILGPGRAKRLDARTKAKAAAKQGALREGKENKHQGKRFARINADGVAPGIRPREKENGLFYETNLPGPVVPSSRFAKFGIDTRVVVHLSKLNQSVLKILKKHNFHALIESESPQPATVNGVTFRF